VVSFRLQPLYPGKKEPPVAIGWEAGWVPEPVSMGGEEKKSRHFPCRKNLPVFSS